MERQIVVFDLAKEHFGVDIGVVESIIKLQTITRVPMAPQYIEGVTNLRGKVLPVIDLRNRFGLERKASNHDTRIIVINLNSAEVGMIVDAVSEVLTIHTEDIEPPSPIVTTIASAFIEGIAKLDDRLVILVDLERTITLDRHGAPQSG